MTSSSVVAPGADGEEQGTLVRMGKKKAGREFDGRTRDEGPMVGSPRQFSTGLRGPTAGEGRSGGSPLSFAVLADLDGRLHHPAAHGLRVEVQLAADEAQAAEHVGGRP
jgi:hypothetical protein